MKNIIAVFVCLLGLASSVIAGDISVSDLKKSIAEQSVTVIDVNGTAKYNKAHIPTAINYASSKDELKSLLPEDKDALIVAYCGGPKCGAYKKAVASAEALGYTNVKHLSAGISGWKSAGEATEAVAKK